MVPEATPAFAPTTPPGVFPPDFVYRMEGKFTHLEPIGPVPEGVRMNAHFEGRVTEGPLAGARVSGVDYLLLRGDGVTVLDLREVITTPTGQTVGIRGHGYSPGTPSLPPVEALQDPAFTWPDEPSPLLGIAFCETAGPDLLWLNRTILAFSGTGNLGAARLEVTARPLTDEMVRGSGLEARSAPPAG